MEVENVCITSFKLILIFKKNNNKPEIEWKKFGKRENPDKSS